MLDINFFSIGAKMAAEYQPQTGKYYYYTSDQIGSTCIVTDDAGNIVYAVAHDPNCDINIRENCWFIRMLAFSSGGMSPNYQLIPRLCIA